MSRHLNIVLAVVFLIVGILATANTIRFNRYVQETMPRDQAQEACNTATVEVLTKWVVARADRDAAMDARDDAAVVVLSRIIDEGKADPQEIAAWRDAVAADKAVRGKVEEQRTPLPNC